MEVEKQNFGKEIDHCNQRSIMQKGRIICLLCRFDKVDMEILDKITDYKCVDCANYSPGNSFCKADDVFVLVQN